MIFTCAYAFWLVPGRFAAFCDVLICVELCGEVRDGAWPGGDSSVGAALTADRQLQMIHANLYPWRGDMAKDIDLDLVRHIGRLSRIELTDEQVQTFSRQLSSILGYFDKLQELDTEGVEPMAHAVELTNVLADDAPAPTLRPDQALANAPQRDGDFFKVPKVIGDSQ